jgi:hypothetical protein
MPYRLVRKGSSEEIKVGDKVENDPFDGIPIEYTVEGFRPPEHANSSGRVIVSEGGAQQEFFPHVFDLEIIVEPYGRRFSADFTGGGIVILKPLDPAPVTLDGLIERRGGSRTVLHANGPCMVSYGPKGGQRDYSEGWRVNGAVKTWKTRPGDFRLPIKYGYKTHHGYVTHINAAQYHFADECPLNLLPKTRDEVLALLKQHGHTLETKFEFVLTDEEVAR